MVRAADAHTTTGGTFDLGPRLPPERDAGDMADIAPIDERDQDQPYGRAVKRRRRSFRERVRDRARAERWPLLSWLDRIKDKERPGRSDGGMTL